MTDCLFCSIAAGEIPADIVHSDETFIAFRDINPQAPIHVLVIPRQHVPTAGELAAAEPDIAGRLLATAAALATEFGLAAGYRIVVENLYPYVVQAIEQVQAQP